jgi:hypothetical protein
VFQSRVLPVFDIPVNGISNKTWGRSPRLQVVADTGRVVNLPGFTPAGEDQPSRGVSLFSKARLMRPV